MNFYHGFHGSITCGTACAEGYRKKLWVELRQLLARGTQLGYTLFGLRWKKLKADDGLFHY
jgi:hypothetical protein